MAGKFEYRVTEESLMDRLTTDTREACKLISKECRSDFHVYDSYSVFPCQMSVY